MLIAIVILLGLITVIVILAFSSATIVPPFHFGVLERLGRRTGDIFKEGINFKVPFIDEVELISLELSEIPVEVLFTTKDRLTLKCNGSLQFRPDIEVIDDYDRNVFVTMSEDIIASGIRDAIKAKLGSLGGNRESGEFIENRNSIADLINSTFRLNVPPHLNHDSSTCGVQIEFENEEKKKDMKNCDLPHEVLAKDLLEFYRSHWRIVKSILDRETFNHADHSTTEMRYGIDIVLFALADIDFSDETRKSFEKKQQADLRAQAFIKKIEMAEKAKALGASPQEALNAADISLDPSIQKTITSVEGNAGVLGAFAESLSKKGGK